MPGIPNYPELFLTLDLYSGIMDGIGKILGKPEFNLSSTSAWQMKLQHENVTQCTVLLQNTVRVASTSAFQNYLTFPENFPDFGVHTQLLNISIDIHISLFLCKYKYQIWLK